MAKQTGKKSFLDFFKMKDLDDDDEFDDDLFDDDDDDDDDYDYVSRRSRSRQSQRPEMSASSYSQPRQAQSSYSSATRQPSSQGGRVVDFNSRPQRSENYRGKSEVYVIRPQEISEAQTVADCLKQGKTIVVNMEGVELAPAQRIIDFIGGACYAIDGTLQAISANIFIAAPNTIEVSGDLREEILNESTVSPQLGRF